MTEINLTFDEGTTLEQIVVFEAAKAIWSSHLEDDATLNFHVAISDELPEGVIGGAVPSIVSSKEYKDVRKGLIDDAKSAADETAVEHLPEEKDGKISVSANTDDDIKLKSINITSANAKALGLVDEHSSDLDAYIVLNDLASTPDVSWDTDTTRTSTAGANTIDMLSVAIHEMGHALGFVSSVDSSDWLDLVLDGQDDKKGKIKDNKGSASPLDFFRYTSDAANAKPDLSIGSVSGKTPYFSVDGGETNLANFALGKSDALRGDGYQASHWEYNPEDPIGIFDPALVLGERREISALDLQALDVVGWDLPENPVTINYEAITAEAKQNIADQLQIDVASLNRGVADELVEDRLQEVSKIVKDSELYEWGWRRTSTSILWYFQELADQPIGNAAPQVEAVQPESAQVDPVLGVGQETVVVGNPEAELPPQEGNVSNNYQGPIPGTTGPLNPHTQNAISDIGGNLANPTSQLPNLGSNASGLSLGSDSASLLGDPLLPGSLASAELGGGLPTDQLLS